MVPGMQCPRVGKALLLTNQSISSINWVPAAEAAGWSVVRFGRMGFVWRSIHAVGARRVGGSWPQSPSCSASTLHAAASRKPASWQPPACRLPPCRRRPSVPSTHYRSAHQRSLGSAGSKRPSSGTDATR